MRRKRAIYSLSMAAVIYVLLHGRSARELGAGALAIAVHEAGHIVPMLLMGLRLRSLTVEPGGLCIRYSGRVTPEKELITVLLGPVAGILFAALPVTGERFSLCAEMSLLYSVFNLLPISPLDGGRALKLICDITDHKADPGGLEKILALAIALSGALLALEGRGMGLLCAGIWLVFYQFDSTGLVN